MMTSDPWDCSVGVDIEEVDRIRAVVRRWGDRFLKRHFTDGEIAYCRSQARPAESLAVRFAAKEAFAKAYPGGGVLGWHDVEVIKDGRRPVLRLSGAAAGYEAKISLSHTHEHAVAVVVVRPKRSADAATPRARG
jgi:holo-[acyl-carrier protein] synthase